MNMSEKRFVGQMCMDKLLVHFEDRDSEQNIPPIATIKDMEIVDKLNEQQATNDYLEEANSRLQVQLGETLRLVDEQQSTINHLKQDLEEYKENWDDMVELATKTSLRNVELDEQIGQLRKELNDCEKFRYTVFKRIGELNDE